MKSYNVIIQIKATEQFVPMVVFIMLYHVAPKTLFVIHHTADVAF